jgi:magnesium chelatase family protein
LPANFRYPANLRPIRGALAMALQTGTTARPSSCPKAPAKRHWPPTHILAARSLLEVCAHLAGRDAAHRAPHQRHPSPAHCRSGRGARQAQAKRALKSPRLAIIRY